MAEIRKPGPRKTRGPIDRIMVCMDAALAQELRETATKRGTSATAMIHEALREHLAAAQADET